MKATRSVSIDLWTNAQAADGSTRIGGVPRWSRGEVEDSLAGDGGLRLSVPTADAWVAEARRGRVLQLHDEVLGADGGEFAPVAPVAEFRISRISKVDGVRDAITEIEAQPILADLADVGPLYQMGADGVPDFSLGEQTLSVRQAWDNLIDPFLADLGIDYWDMVVSGGRAVPVSVSAVTPLGLLRAIATAEDQDPSLQVWAVHDGATRIRVCAAPRGFAQGVISATRRYHEHRDGWRILRIVGEESSERAGSVVVPVREPVPGGSDDLGLTGLVFRVSAVNGSDITLQSIGSGFYPLGPFEDQYGGAVAP